jgi:hypothetical protein
VELADTNMKSVSINPKVFLLLAALAAVAIGFMLPKPGPNGAQRNGAGANAGQHRG